MTRWVPRVTAQRRSHGATAAAHGSRRWSWSSDRSWRWRLVSVAGILRGASIYSRAWADAERDGHGRRGRSTSWCGTCTGWTSCTRPSCSNRSTPLSAGFFRLRPLGRGRGGQRGGIVTEIFGTDRQAVPDRLTSATTPCCSCGRGGRSCLSGFGARGMEENHGRFQFSPDACRSVALAGSTACMDRVAVVSTPLLRGYKRVSWHRSPLIGIGMTACSEHLVQLWRSGGWRSDGDRLSVWCTSTASGSIVLVHRPLIGGDPDHLVLHDAFSSVRSADHGEFYALILFCVAGMLVMVQHHAPHDGVDRARGLLAVPCTC